MKKHRGKPVFKITPSEIDSYAEMITSDEDSILKDLVKESDDSLDFIDMISGKVVGTFLQMLIKISGSKRVLEVGTFTGYSALMMAQALPEGGEVFTFEMNYRYMNLAQSFFDRFDKEHKVTLVSGNALENIPKIEGEFDLAYLDGDKLRYPDYYEMLIPRIPSGGLLVADNVLWDGTVLNPEDNKSEAINRFNQIVREDHRVEQVLLPVRDGLLVVRKK